MQVTMTMEEYEELTFKNEKVIEELKETYNSEILAMQNRLMLEVRKLRSGKEKLESKINNEIVEYDKTIEEMYKNNAINSNAYYMMKGFNVILSNIITK